MIFMHVWKFNQIGLLRICYSPAAGQKQVRWKMMYEIKMNRVKRLRHDNRFITSLPKKKWESTKFILVFISIGEIYHIFINKNRKNHKNSKIKHHCPVQRECPLPCHAHCFCIPIVQLQQLYKNCFYQHFKTMTRV